MKNDEKALEPTDEQIQEIKKICEHWRVPIPAIKTKIQATRFIKRRLLTI